MGAEKDPEDETEIQTHLAKIKAAHGFTELTARREGDLWAVQASMNPQSNKAAQIKAEGKNKTSVGDRSNGRGELKSKDGTENYSVYFGPLVNGCGSWMIARLGPDDHVMGSSVGSARPPWWEEMRNAQGTDAEWVTKYMVQGHLLNEKLGGPNDMKNLTPITKKANAEHHNHVEKAAKEIRARGNHIHYKVKVNYDSAPAAGSFNGNIAPKYLPNLASQIECKLTEFHGTTKQQIGNELVKIVKNET